LKVLCSKSMNKQSLGKEDWGVSYGEMVCREFTKSRLNVVCLVFIIFLFLIAVLSPFLANDKPFVIRIDGQLHFPIFKNLDSSDYSIFLAAIIGVLQLLLIRRNRRRIEPSIRSSVLWRQTWINVVILVTGIVLLFVFIPRRLDATDYKSMLAVRRAELFSH